MKVIAKGKVGWW